MILVTQTLEEVLAALQPLEVEWEDDTAIRVMARLRTWPEKREYTVDDVHALLRGVGNGLDGFDDGLLIARLLLGVSKDKFEIMLKSALGVGGTGVTRYRNDPDGYVEALDKLGLTGAMTREVNRPLHWTDTMIERLRTGRGSAISGQKRGRDIEDYAETIVRAVFGERFESRGNFIGKGGVEAKCDFAIPSMASPRIIIEAKGYGATGSKMTDVIGDIVKIINARRTDTTFLFFTDGETWSARQSDLRKIIRFQNDGDIARIYTRSMKDALLSDLTTLKFELGL